MDLTVACPSNLPIIGNVSAVIAALERRDVAAIGQAARTCVLREHSADVRAAQLETELLAAARLTVRVSRPKVEA